VGQVGPLFLYRSEDDVVVGGIGGAFVGEEGTIEIGFAVVASGWNGGYATAAIEALVTTAREGIWGASHRGPHGARAPSQRPRLEKAGFAVVREMEVADEAGDVVGVKEWELVVC
jgi:hypothetical protein